MDKIKAIAGLISFIGSLFLFIALLLSWALIIALDINALLNLSICIVAWAGSTIGMNGKRFGGALTLGVGLILIIFYILFLSDPISFQILAPFSFFAVMLRRTGRLPL